MDQAPLLQEVSDIVCRQREGLVALAGLDAGRTDYTTRNDLLRLIEIADQVAHKTE